MDTAGQLARAAPFKFPGLGDLTHRRLGIQPHKKLAMMVLTGLGCSIISLITWNVRRIVIQVTGASGSQRAKFDRLQTTIRNENAAMGILITLDAQTARRNWTHTLETYPDGRNHLRPYTVFLYRGILPKQRTMGSNIDPPLACEPVDRQRDAENFI